VANGEEARMRYREALDCLARGDGAWHARLDDAVAAAPLRLDFRLQRLLMELSFGAEPDEEQLLRVKDWRVSRPNYYLVHYIESRMQELGGNDRAALDACLRSLELEPRDPMGIRWGRAAIIARRLGLDAGTYAWRAIQRGVWGAACVLDHPVYGAAFRREMAARLAGFRVGSAQELMQAHQASVALVDRGAASLTLPMLAGPAVMVPEWLTDGCGSVELKLASNTAGAASVIASAAAGLDTFLVARLRALCAMADATGAFEIVDRAAERLRSVWSYRNKNDEDPWLLWWLARSALTRNDPAGALGLLDRLDAMDPANPWILERRGVALQALGDAREAREAFEAALRVVPIARLDPLFAAGPRELYAPAGDQWSFALERAFRRFDEEADAYHAEAWTRLRDALEQKLGTPRSGQGTSNTSPNRSE
ncbi:MAG TPA: hypothetical protein VIV61_15275, partial [Candidatus Ozemobacteraceae bacterium]